jgi:polyhydroxyalkanoate synthesis regulator phasin
VLAPLVADGTLTQAQADAVVDAVVAAGPIGRGPGHHAQGHHGRRGLHLDVVASTLGITVEELRTQLAGGATIADVAGAQTQAVIDALVAEATERIEQGVSDSRLTREEADEKLADLPERIAERVDSPLPSRDGPDGRDG